jgi:hypothetical protein
MEQRQHERHTIVSVLFGHTGAGTNPVAPDFPRWADPITHENWSSFNRGEQYFIGQILNSMHYWRGVLLPGDAAFADGLPRHIYVADVDIESYTDLDWWCQDLATKIEPSQLPYQLIASLNSVPVSSVSAETACDLDLHADTSVAGSNFI